AVDPVIKEIVGVGHASFELLLSLPSDKRIGVFALRQLDDANDEIVFQQCIKRALRRLGARGVGVEAQNQFINETLQDAGLIFRERSSLWGDHIRAPRFEQADLHTRSRSSPRLVPAWMCAIQKARSLFEKAVSQANSDISPRLPRLSGVVR